MQISRGRILVQRLFDVADAIDLVRAEACVAKLYRRPRFAGSARHIQLPRPPVEMSLGPKSLGFAGHTAQDTLCRLWDVGALTLTFILDIPPGTDGEALIRLGQQIGEAEEQITAAAQPLVEEIRRAIAPACKLAPDEAAGQALLGEEYTIFLLQATEPCCDADSLGEALDIPRLLLGETEPIAACERRRLVQASLSYRPDDLVVIDWNAAVVLDPTGGVDITELLELTSMQLLELRAYDKVVERALGTLYSELERESSGFFRSAYFLRLSRRIMKLFVDITEVMERIDNSLTVLGDSWLARLHRTAVSEFGIDRWQRQLRYKLEMLRQINELIVDQITSQKSLNIEMAIFGLIILEVVIALINHYKG
jgi:hypothetical protein